MFYTGIEGIGTNDVSATASVSHHVNLALHWTIARQGSQFTSCACIYAEGHLLIFFMHNGGMKDFGDRQYGMQVSLRIGLPEADRPINHLTCPSGVVLNVTEHAPPPSLMNHIPHLCLALLLENNTRRQTAPLTSLDSSLSSFFILNPFILSLPILSAHNGFWFLCYWHTVLLQSL